MSDLMTFPYSVEEFMERYKIVDTDGIYMSKGAELVPIFRMRQWFEHLPSAQRTGRWIRKSNWMWTCSCCGSDNAYAYKADDAYEPTVLQDFFCPNCGAKMEEQG